MGDESMDWEPPNFDEIRDRNTRVRKHKNSRLRLISMKNYIFIACVLTSIPWFILVFAPFEWFTKLAMCIILMAFQCFVVVPSMSEKLHNTIKKVEKEYTP